MNLPDGYSLFYFCSVVLNYKDLDPYVHGTLCHFLEHPQFGRYRDATVPRSWFKTSIATIGKSMWLPIRRDPNIRILIAMNTADNAEKRIHVIKNHWQSNSLLQQAFPELVPDFKHTRWSNSCAELRRTRRSEEGTYESIGVGGAVISRHYDHIDEDDLVFAKKDDLGGGEIQPNQEDIDKAIGWHKLVYSLFSDPQLSTLDNIGTRWGVHDLKRWIWDNEKDKFKSFMLSAEKLHNGMPTGEPVWASRFPREALDSIRSSQGPYMYATQYLNMPRDPSDAVFKPEWLGYYYDDSLPQQLHTITVVDLALWGDSKGKAMNVICTMSMDSNHHVYIRRYDRGKYNPDEVIQLMEMHSHLYSSRVYVEEIQYQRAIRYFARKRMEQSGKWYPLEAIKYDGRSGAKDLRIRNIVSLACNGGLHIKHSMKDLYREYCDYPSAVTVDILDCIGHGIRILRPTRVVKEERNDNPLLFDNVIAELERTKSGQYPIANGLVNHNPDGTRL